MLNIHYTKIGPSNEDLKERNNLRKCQKVLFQNGDFSFSCQNDTTEYDLNIIPFNNKIKIWINEGMLCSVCINELSNKYNINFRMLIPILEYEKGWGELSNNYYLSPCIDTNIYKTDFYKSLNNSIQNNSIENYVDNFIDPETTWFIGFNHLYGIPKKWTRELTLKNIITSGTKKQGANNGPDYIFNNKKNGKEIGFEIISWRVNRTNSFKSDKSYNNFINKTLFLNNKFDDFVKELKVIIDKKSLLKNSYIKTDEIYLGIVVFDTIQDYEYHILEIILNDYNVKRKKGFNKIFLL